MTAREIVHVRAKDFATAVYVTVGLRESTRYLVQTDNLCPDCTTPMIVLDGIEGDGGAGVLHMYHDVDCPVVRLVGGETVSMADRTRVAETRRRYLDDALEAWSDWG
ncbi:hypothetical protein [Mycolicibacterium sp.]|uniref:hypothetical protein n=1 Tax=Mycolicibacterium sp. TaxID=2320850 RepID=UPI0028B1C585|nr:hypothetical protein [Mycolicibacterium sp.]